MRRALSIPAPLSGAIETELPGCCVLLQCGIDPRTSGRMDCDVIDVNFAQDESAKTALSSICMEVTYKRPLLGLSLLALADFAHM